MNQRQGAKGQERRDFAAILTVGETGTPGEGHSQVEG
jgi:hypothetical protein